jgi:sigma-B regulation protein RsbU (phosphoserine phosphatase)
MGERTYLAGFLVGAAVLLYVGRHLLVQSALVTWGLTFAGTTAAGVLGITLYRVQLELRASRHELARKEAELNFAYEVQQALFPQKFPADTGLEFAGSCVPARGISGDYYDVLELPGGRTVFTFSDISGKGISAAILMSNLHAVTRMLAAGGGSPTEVCSRLNSHFHQITDGLRFATLFYAEWDRAENCLRHINAGHMAPILFASSHGRRFAASAPPLGLFAETRFQEDKTCLDAGDLLVLFSDGVTEATNSSGIEFGESRLEAVVASCRAQPVGKILEQVVKAVRDWAGGELNDDMTLLLVRARRAGEEGV